MAGEEYGFYSNSWDFYNIGDDTKIMYYTDSPLLYPDCTELKISSSELTDLLGANTFIQITTAAYGDTDEIDYYSFLLTGENVDPALLKDQSTTPTKPTQPTTPVADGDGNYKVHTTAGKGLNVRTGPGTEYKRACPALREGTVVEVVELKGQWGKLANDAGWVFMPGLDKIASAEQPAEPEKPAEPEQTFPVTMQVDNSKGALNVRTGPGTNYKKAGPSLKNGTEIEVVEIKGQWGKLADDAGWVYLPGAKTVKG